MDRSVYDIDGEFDSPYFQTISELPPPPNYSVMVGMLLGISRGFTNNSDPASNRRPYYLHMTDFTENQFTQLGFFNNRNFKKEKLNGKTYDIVMYPQCFDYLVNKLKDKVNLYDHVRYYESQGSNIFYVNESSDGNNPKWYLDKFNIWLLCKIREKIYRQLVELTCVSTFSVIPEKDIKERLGNFNKIEVWNGFTNVFNNSEFDWDSDLDFTSDFDSDFHDENQNTFKLNNSNMSVDVVSFNDSDSVVGNNSFTKRRKLSDKDQDKDRDTDQDKDNDANNTNDDKICQNMEFILRSKNVFGSQTKNNKIKVQRESTKYFTIPTSSFIELTQKPTEKSKVFNFNYSLISELKSINEYKPQYIIISKFEIVQEYENYVYGTADNEWGITSVKLRVFDERGDDIVIYLRGFKVLTFLQIDKTQYTHSNDLNESIKGAFVKMADKLRNNNNFIGMVVGGYEISPDIWKWRYEFSSDFTISL